MLGLKELQKAFKQNILQGDDGIIHHVVGSDALPNELRLAIYGNAYRLRLIEALASDYEILKILLGDQAFETVCLDYIEAYPSRFASLRWFGQYLPRYLGYAADTGVHDWLAEMAQLEWSFTEAFDAADAKVSSEVDMANVPPESWPGLTLRFHPSLRLVTTWWNTVARWRETKHGDKQQDTVLPPQRLPQPSECLMWRQELTTQYRSLEADESIALQAALDGANFSEICGVLADELADQEQVPMKAAGFLKTWLAAGLIAELVPN